MENIKTGGGSVRVRKEGHATEPQRGVGATARSAAAMQTNP
jgi:hypothetical protein